MPPWLWTVLLAVFVMLLLFMVGHRDYMHKKHPGLVKEKTAGGGKQKGGPRAAQQKGAGTADRSTLKGYVPAERLPAGSKRLLEEEMTYREFLKKFPEFQADAEIDAQTRLLVLRTATKNSRGQTLLSTAVYRMPSGSLLLESVKVVEL